MILPGLHSCMHIGVCTHTHALAFVWLVMVDALCSFLACDVSAGLHREQSCWRDCPQPRVCMWSALNCAVAIISSEEMIVMVTPQGSSVKKERWQFKKRRKKKEKGNPHSFEVETTYKLWIVILPSFVDEEKMPDNAVKHWKRKCVPT